MLFFKSSSSHILHVVLTSFSVLSNYRSVCFDVQHTFDAVMTQAMWAILQHFYQPLKKVSKILNCLKNIFEKKKNGILLHKMILHMQKWGGSPLYPIFELQRI